MKKLTLNHLKQAAERLGGECLSTEYIDSHKPAMWRCKHGHIWSSPAKSILYSGSWCPFCAGRRHDLAEMQQIAASRGGKCISSKYFGMQKKLTWGCAHGHVWKSTPATVVIAGSWCPECSAGLGERLTRAAFEHFTGKTFQKCKPDWLVSERATRLELDGYNEELQVAFEHQGDQHYKEIAFFTKNTLYQQRKNDDETKRRICLSRGVILIEVQQVGRQISVANLGQWVETALLSKGVKIVNSGSQPNYRPAYATSGATTALERLRALAIGKGGKCLESLYLGSKEPHRFICDRGHKWSASAESISQGKWCAKCAAAKKAVNTRHSQNSINEIAIRRGGKLISSKYENSSSPLLWQCSEGHQWSAPFNRIRDGKWCPECSRWTAADLQRLAGERGGQFLSLAYVGAKVPHQWQCDKEHTWYARPNNIINGTWCPYCAKNNRAQIEDMDAIARERNGKCLSRIYINAREKLLWSCENGHEWKAVPHSIKSGSWCPMCSPNSRLSVK